MPREGKKMEAEYKVGIVAICAVVVVLLGFTSCSAYQVKERGKAFTTCVSGNHNVAECENGVSSVHGG